MPRVCKILLVEDYDEVREMLSEALDLEGFQFTAVASAREMHEALDREDYDIAVIDISLPGGEDGFTLAEAAHDLGCGVILITGDHSHKERLEQSGHHHLLKPFGVRDFLALVSRVLAEIASRCVRRKRRNGEFFPLRAG
ncbi:MAG TPA: response regulator [Stellaceae bacterium]|jgi:two-component system phosphate regulon response regulator OmpR|nr:response regulator [Stellaceae bacterium]